MWTQRSFKRIFALVIIIALALFLAYALLQYMNAFFGAIIFFTLFHPLHKVFAKKIGKKLAALIIIFISMLVVLVPAYYLFTATVNEVSVVVSKGDQILGYVESLDTTVRSFLPGVDLKQRLIEKIPEIGDFFSRLLLGAVQEISQGLITITIMYFIFYYLLIADKKILLKKVHEIIPFNRKNTTKLIKEFQTVTNSTIITTGLIAVIQGILLTLGFLFFGIPGAFFWGFVGGFLSFFPVVGPFLVWIPAVIIKFFQKQYPASIGILIWGLILSNVDNLLRPFIQQRVGKMHPLVSIVGIFMGLAFFGLLGIVIGPLLISYFLLTIEMFSEEHF